MTRALCLVAHPDDCVIFGYSFMYHYQRFHWTVCYLTYTDQDARGQELAGFWQQRGIDTKFLGYQDDWRDIERKSVSFDAARAQQDINSVCRQFDLVLTHDSRGDYGHPHHKFVHDSVPQDHPCVIYFAPINTGTVRLTIPSGIYDVSELPAHGDIVQSFHRLEHVNEYQITDRAAKHLESWQ